MRRIVIVLIVVGAVFVWLVSRGGHASERFYTGTIEGRDIAIGSLTGGRVVAIRTDEGAPIAKGDTVLLLETTLIDAQILEQRDRIAASKAAYERALAGPRTEEIERARIEWERAEKERKRREALVGDDLVSREAFDAATATAGQALQTYEQLKRGTREEDKEQAAALMAVEQRTLAYLDAKRDESVVVSPADGRVQTFDLRPGDLVGPNQAVATILPDGDLWVRVYVPENRIGAIRIGQAASFTVDTYPERAFDATVIAVRDHAEYTPRNVQTAAQRRDRVFAVKLSVAPEPELKAGMTATVRFL